MFDLEIKPLAITNVDWATYIDFIKESLGYSPVKGLDTLGLDIKFPQAFLATLDFSDDPLNYLRTRQRHPGFYHVCVAFIALLDKDILYHLYKETEIKISAHDAHRDQVCILSESMSEWYEIIYMGCLSDKPFEVRLVLNRILLLFERMGFHDIWGGFEKIYLKDKTFILKAIR